MFALKTMSYFAASAAIFFGTSVAIATKGPASSVRCRAR